MVGALLAAAVAIAVAGRCGSPAAPPSPADPRPGEVLPGVAALPGPVTDALRRAERPLATRFAPRHRLPDGSPRYTNRLALAASAYLREHAHDPVSWYPWGADAFQAARELGRPLFVSVGHFGCQACRTMHEESFEDVEIARFLNEQYVAVLVDRDERPDVDGVFMVALEKMNVTAAWPMSVWLTDQQLPYSGAAYLPARDGDHGVKTGLLTVLGELRRAFDREPERVRGAAQDVAARLAAELTNPVAGPVPPGVLNLAARQYRTQFDPINGGPQDAPKYPSATAVRLLLRGHFATGNPELLHMARLTLEQMAKGGIHDQLGGGFHELSLDEEWRVPAFGKTLCGNALIAVAYLEAFQATGDAAFAAVARDTLDFMDRELSTPDGAFVAALGDGAGPAAGEGPGWYYTWTPAELRALLGPRAGPVAARLGIGAAGEAESRSVPRLALPAEEVALAFGLAPAGVATELATALDVLRRARAERRPPERDPAVVTAWNGLALSAFARAARVLGDSSRMLRAERAATFLQTRLSRGNRVVHALEGGAPSGPGFLQDHAFAAAGFLDLFEATGRLPWLERAIELDSAIEAHFEDADHGGFFVSASDALEGLPRQRQKRDGAEPSGTAVHAHTLVRLATITASPRQRLRATRAFESLGGILAEDPTALSALLLGVDLSLAGPALVLVVTPSGVAEAEPFLATLRGAFFPHATVLVAPVADVPALARLVPRAAGLAPQAGKPAAYVCDDLRCTPPITDPAALTRTLNARRAP